MLTWLSYFPCVRLQDALHCSAHVPGLYTAIQLRLSAWARNPGADNVHHGLPLPNLLHIRDDVTVRCSEHHKAVSRPGLSNAHSRHPTAAEAWRQYWIPICCAR